LRPEELGASAVPTFDVRGTYQLHRKEMCEVARAGHSTDDVRRKVVKWLWFAVATILLGTIGSMVATALFDWRLPPWLMKPATADNAAVPKGTPEETATDWHRTGWLLAGIGGTVVAILVVIACLGVDVSRNPVIADYRKDMFFGLTWRWKYYGEKIVSLACFCPTCDRQLKIQEVDRWPSVYALVCAVHGELHRPTGDIHEFLDDATREIHLNIRNGNWTKKVS
jgi:amino acid transporter